jgi:hypothetical protein
VDGIAAADDGRAHASFHASCPERSTDATDAPGAPMPVMPVMPPMPPVPVLPTPAAAPETPVVSYMTSVLSFQ